MLIYDSPTLWHSTALITSDADIDNNACDSLSMLNEWLTVNFAISVFFQMCHMYRA